MSCICCNKKCHCTFVAIIVSVVVGLLLGFAQLSSPMGLTPTMVAVPLIFAVFYLAVTFIVAAIARFRMGNPGLKSALKSLFVGIVGTVVSAAILLLTGINSGLLGSLFVGLEGAFFILMLISVICLITHLTRIDDE